MNYKPILVFGSLCFLFAIGHVGVRAQSTGKLQLKIQSSKQVYRLGEPVDLTFQLHNVSDSPVPVDCFWTSTGALTVYLADSRKSDFAQYDAGWGTVEAVCNNIIKPGGNLQTSAKILWNRVIEDSNLISPDVTKRARVGRIASSYAFPKPGVYLIKASAFNYATAKIESEPLEVTIEAPVGEDLEVWNKIKNSCDIAYFIQIGDLQAPSYKPDEREKVLQEIEQIINQYPDSFYAEMLRDNLSKFHAAEARRKQAAKN